jgi:RNA polymerase sigma-70 factor (ECF subfamily)
MKDPNSKNDESSLIQAALDGDRNAFGNLVTKYQDRLFNSLIHVLGCENEAMDVVQDAFLQAFRRLDSFRAQSAFYTWLFRIARNLAISRIRSRRHATSIHNIDGFEIDIQGRENQPGQPMEARESVAQLQIAMSKLSEEHRTIIVLRELEGLDYDEIAIALEIPVGTVRSRLHRARSQLKNELVALGAVP